MVRAQQTLILDQHILLRATCTCRAGTDCTSSNSIVARLAGIICEVQVECVADAGETVGRSEGAGQTRGLAGLAEMLAGVVEQGVGVAYFVYFEGGVVEVVLLDEDGTVKSKTAAVYYLIFGKN